MANRLSAKDFTYYFAVTADHYRVYQRYLRGQSVLVSLAHIPRAGKPREEFMATLKRHSGQVMIDSGGFSNFATPGKVNFDEWAEFMLEHKSWVDEYVQFDDLRSRAQTIKLYEKAKAKKLQPLFVDHLWFRSQKAYLDRVWKQNDKLCMSGFARTGPGQESFPDDPVVRMRERMQKAEDDDTMCHMLAVGSLRRFLPYFRRVHSVDSAGWQKAAVYGGFQVFRYEDWHGVRVPMLVAYSHPHARNSRRPIPQGMRAKLWDSVVAANKWGGKPKSDQGHCVSLYHAKRYVAALKQFDPTQLIQKLAGKDSVPVQKMLNDETACTDFEFPDLDPRDPETPDTGWEPPPQLEGVKGFIIKQSARKQAQEYLQYPPDEEGMPFVVQQHWRGKNVHTDIRVKLNRNLALGWTLNTQVAGKVNEPIMTLAEAKARATEPDYSKVDWTTGEWQEIDSKRVPLVAQRKPVHPVAWLEMEGRTSKTVPGQPPPPGATAEYPGVFHIVDRGEVEFGAQKPWLHEYFFHGRRLHYRVFFRKTAIGDVQKARHSHSVCMHCEQPPTVDVIWADGRGRAWFCQSCFATWKAESDREIVRERSIVGPAAPTEFGEVHKRAVPVTRASSHPLAKADGDEAWLAVYPEDPVPYVLSADAVRKEWMPPVGVSALPSAIRSQVPVKHRFWDEKDEQSAQAKRDALHQDVRSGTVTIDWDAAYQPVKRKTAAFELQRQEVRGDAPRHEFCLRAAVTPDQVLALKFAADPREAQSGSVQVALEDALAPMGLGSGVLRPGHYANIDKTMPSELQIVDSGPVEVLFLRKDFIKLRLEGAHLTGALAATCEGETWQWQATSEAGGSQQPEEALVAKRAEELVTATRFVPILKIDKAKRLVTGVVLEPGERDAHDDAVPREIVEKAAHRFLARYNEQTKLGLMHEAFGDIGVELAESWVAPVKLRLGGEPVKEGTWIMSVKVVSDDTWAKVKKGQYTGFSVGGIATVPG
jgi:hypothetical protein